MAKAKVVHSDDAATIVFEGDKSKPEPSTGIIKFPGGYVEVSRTSDGGYWAHLYVHDPKHVDRSRVGYDFAGYELAGMQIPDLPHSEHVKHVGIRVRALTPEEKETLERL